MGAFLESSHQIHWLLPVPCLALSLRLDFPQCSWTTKLGNETMLGRVAEYHIKKCFKCAIFWYTVGNRIRMINDALLVLQSVKCLDCRYLKLSLGKPSAPLTTSAPWALRVKPEVYLPEGGVGLPLKALCSRFACDNWRVILCLRC